MIKLICAILCDAGIKTKLEEEVPTGYGISIMNLVMCNYIQMNVVLNTVLVVLVICDYGSCRVRVHMRGAIFIWCTYLIIADLTNLRCLYWCPGIRNW
ncbi:hypothetical protein SETIT_4G076200v2 [Setaria italica]|uniref:Uncharacterized protein n=1 Tax=Setaria italica TaxID=4555 RepID=A0A368QRU0_SETIT|nr:hypothetical protein SETIT_4G076200v2 [Setaria italica]